MSQEQTTITNRRLRTPRAAAIAGILFALLFATSLVLIRLAVPEGLADGGAWLVEQSGTITLAMALTPFAGIAFLWFIGVLRARIGDLEDQLFATVFLGSGLLFLALVFVGTALAGGTLAAYAAGLRSLPGSDAYVLVRAFIHQILNVFGFRMAGVFMISLGSIGLRTKVLPRWLVIATYLLALVLLLALTFSLLVQLIFPAWVFVVSIYLLFLDAERRAEKAVSA